MHPRECRGGSLSRHDVEGAGNRARLVKKRKGLPSSFGSKDEGFEASSWGGWYHSEAMTTDALRQKNSYRPEVTDENQTHEVSEFEFHWSSLETCRSFGTGARAVDLPSCLSW